VAPAAADSDVLIIDDGFQRVQIARDLDLVCFGASGVGNGRMLPAGILRDPISELARADAFVGAVATLPAFYPDTPRFDFSVRRLVFTPGPPGPGARVAALAAIAAPSRFFAALRAAGIAPVIEVPLPDHHPLLPVSQQKLSRRLHASGVSHLVVTEKDAVKLPASLDGIAVVVARADFGPTDASTLAHFHGFLRARLAR
jgi:tetraacyldisaccharide 4'-kinase